MARGWARGSDTSRSSPDPTPNQRNQSPLSEQTSPPFCISQANARGEHWHYQLCGWMFISLILSFGKHLLDPEPHMRDTEVNKMWTLPSRSSNSREKPKSSKESMAEKEAVKDRGSKPTSKRGCINQQRLSYVSLTTSKSQPLKTTKMSMYTKCTMGPGSPGDSCLCITLACYTVRISWCLHTYRVSSVTEARDRE